MKRIMSGLGLGLALVACGGGGSDTTAPPTPDVAAAVLGTWHLASVNGIAPPVAITYPVSTALGVTLPAYTLSIYARSFTVLTSAHGPTAGYGLALWQDSTLSTLCGPSAPPNGTCNASGSASGLVWTYALDTLSLTRDPTTTAASGTVGSMRTFALQADGSLLETDKQDGTATGVTAIYRRD